MQTVTTSTPASDLVNLVNAENKYSVKLNRDIATYIRIRMAQDETLKITHFARAFNVDTETISMIVRNQTYKDPAYKVPARFALQPLQATKAILDELIAKDVAKAQAKAARKQSKAVN